MSTLNEATTSRQVGDGYVLRPGERSDWNAVRSLYIECGGRSDAWFAWRYEDAPSVERAPIVVAEADGEVVGATASRGLRLRSGSAAAVALQVGTPVVAPAHRDRGLPAEMVAFLRDCAEQDCVLTVMDDGTLTNCLGPDWVRVQTQPTYYRVQNPAGLLDDSRRSVRALARALTPLARSYTAVRDSLAPISAGIDVTRHESVPVATFVDLYRRAVPFGLHAERDRRFYDWRLETPAWSYRAYTGGHDGPKVGIVTGTRTVDGTREVALTDVVPLVGVRRRLALTAVLRRICRDHPDADVVTCRGSAVPASLLSKFGFRPDTSVPISAVTSPATLAVAPAGGDGNREVLGVDVTEPTCWRLSGVEQVPD
ncbi:hypothetical protein VB773_21965 [Haloarculaceae archaeon H-GB2-1]|nr:hypothetical protein [Haloarculaceae archaeon H-GB1-1]MEA5389577.1 hypothetical protein [Haloarculaceae archaeon H-GB11]MEA5409970.1 hypothetical protein [Haloarculaceae archaeon H-GB2-1]